MLKRILFILVLSLSAVFAQVDGPTVVPTEGPPNIAYQMVPVVAGGKIVGLCYARSYNSARRQTQISITSATNANPVVLHSVAHGFSQYSLPSVTISGATGGWVGVNGTFVATWVDADNISIAVNSSGFPVGILGTVVFTTTAPRLNVAEWAVELMKYDTNGLFAWRGWLMGQVGDTKCSDASSTTVANQ